MRDKRNTNLPIILIILDGWGLDKPGEGNAVYLAKTPTMDGLMKKYPFTKLYAHGRHVGLPLKQVGNSEAGHMNIGAGRIVEQDSVKISKSIRNGTFFKNSAFLGAIRHVKKMNTKFHLMGMLSGEQSPHSDPDHLLALIDLLQKNGINEIFLHLFTDGRDSPKYASLQLVDDLEKRRLRNCYISTIMGRFYAMDRKKKWERTEKAFLALSEGVGRKANSAQQAITESYNRGESDEYIQPYIIRHDINTRIDEADSIIFFNLRSDRSRQLTKAFVQKDFNKMNPGSFKRRKKYNHIYFTAMTDFGPDLDDILTAYPSIDINNTLPMVFHDLNQLYLAETEKFAHVTYFFNGGYSGKVASEEQIKVPSPDVKSYDKTPIMSSDELAQIVIDNFEKPEKGARAKYDFITLNFAAPDMVGHTGNIEAGIECCSRLDGIISKIVEVYLMAGGTVVITADHGNIEKMINQETGEIYTQHTTNLVPFLIVNKFLKNKIKLRKKGVLGDIAPTLIKLAGYKKPKEIKRKALY